MGKGAVKSRDLRFKTILLPTPHTVEDVEFEEIKKEDKDASGILVSKPIDLKQRTIPSLTRVPQATKTKKSRPRKGKGQTNGN